jgi:hypothetical protein
MTEYQTVVAVLKFYHCHLNLYRLKAHKKRGSAVAEPPFV